ncbi:unnamed protein product [Psylliodes chrysocephalus]|uniref:Reverse transcriptase domain-containing protein n=1 Tax=Psylliodes chrysocephalus TaxID=3402493 RepID=A0A9P0CPA8_9CUCU|nr:unnamed protein product [Psylliodes chrysocephala]
MDLNRSEVSSKKSSASIVKMNASEALKKCNDANNWNVVNRRRKRNIVVGNNTIEIMKGERKHVSLHVDRINIDTTINDLESILIKNFPEVKCEKLNSLRLEIYSSFKVTILEIPQGSSLGPILLLIIINDLCDNLNCKGSTFTDDCNLYYSILNLECVAL